MIVTDARYRSLAVTREQLRSASFMRAFKECFRREVRLDLHAYPIVARRGPRFYRLRHDSRTQIIVAEWPAERVIADATPARKV